MKTFRGVFVVTFQADAVSPVIRVAVLVVPREAELISSIWMYWPGETVWFALPQVWTTVPHNASEQMRYCGVPAPLIETARLAQVTEVGTWTILDVVRVLKATLVWSVKEMTGVPQPTGIQLAPLQSTSRITSR